MEARGRGNYAPWGLLDWIHGTGIGDADFVDDVRDEAEKHQLKQRSSDVLQASTAEVKSGVRSWAAKRKARK